MNCSIFNLTSYVVCLCFSLSGYGQETITANPDQVYPIPNNYGEVSEAGINLFTGDLNLSFSLAYVSGKHVSYSLDAAYNSRSVSAGLPKVNNELDGKGWKLMDYPKVVKDGSDFYYLDGQRKYILHLDNGQVYFGDGQYYLWQFKQLGDGWQITSDDGIQFTLTNHASTSGGNSYWNLSTIVDPNWSDTLHFGYAKGQITSIKNDLGDSLAILYTGKVSEIRTYHRNHDNSGHTLLKGKTLINYGDSGIISLTNQLRASNGKFINKSPGTSFTYYPNGLLHQVVNPSGAIQSYKYYDGTKKGLLGVVIRYGIDNGYQRIAFDMPNPTSDNPDASYTAVWYSTTNFNMGTESIYRYFNQVRIYPGGFREGSSYTEVHNPFGHQTRYFFNGQSRTSLDSLPSGYGNEDVSSQHLLGRIYKEQQYSSSDLQDDPDELILSAASIYHLVTYGKGSDTTSCSLLEKSYFEEDGTVADTTWYSYYPVDDYYLLESIVSLRYNPKQVDGDNQEYSKTSVQYAFQRYSKLRGLNKLQGISQSWTEVARYAENQSPESSNLGWQVTDARLMLWKPWNGTMGWADSITYQLQQNISPDSLPGMVSNKINRSNWLQVHQILARNKDGLILAEADVDGITSSYSYDSHYDYYPIATFHNCDLTKDEGSYTGFEQYASLDSWQQSAIRIIDTTARTGKQAGVINNTMVSANNFEPIPNRKYVFGAFVLSSDTVKIGFNSGTTWSESLKIKGNSSWQYISVVSEAPVVDSNKPTIYCQKKCLIDDIRFHPVDASFSAQVYEDKSLRIDDITVKGSGNYEANYDLTVAANTKIVSGETLMLRAGEEISFQNNVSFASGSILQVSVLDYSLDLGKTRASLSTNGEVYEKVWNGIEETIGIVGPGNNLRYLNQSYNSREGIRFFGDSDPEDHYFDANYPSMGLDITARKSGIWEGFQFQNQLVFDTLKGFEVVNGQLVTGPFQKHAFAHLNQTIDDNDFAVFVELFPNNLSAGDSLGIGLGKNLDLFKLTLTEKAIVMKGSSKKDPVKSVTLMESPDKIGLTLVVMDGNHVFVYADGRFLFDYQFSDLVSWDIYLISTNPAGAFDNFMLIEDPIIGKNAYDATGRLKQTLFHHEPDEQYVGAQLHGDYLSLPVANTRGAHVSMSNVRGLSYRPGFAKLQIGKNNSPTVTGEVQQAFGYNTPFVASRTYDNDPSFRPERTGSGGSFTAGSTQSINHDYKASTAQNTFKFDSGEVKKNESIYPISSSQKLVSSNFIGSSTGLHFASTNIDSLTGNTIRQQQSFDENLQMEAHYQPNYFSQVTDNGNFVKQVSYDFLGNRVRETDPDRGTTQYAYGPTYRHRVTLDANGIANGQPYYLYWKYDSLGRVIEEGVVDDPGINIILTSSPKHDTLAPGNVTLRHGYYDNTNIQFGNSLRLQKGDTLGKNVRFQLLDIALQTYLKDSLANVQWPAKGRKKHTYVYDYTATIDTIYALGRLVSTTSYDTPGVNGISNTETYTYDLAGRVIQQQLKLINGSQKNSMTFDYNYDLTSNVITIKKSASTYSFNYDVAYSYDRLNRIESIGSSSDADQYASYQYSNGGFVETFNYTGYKSIEAKYKTNEEGLLDSIQYLLKVHGNTGVLFSENLYYTERKNEQTGYFNGNISSIVTKPNNITHELIYDGFGRLKADSIKSSNGSVTTNSWTYDANGNILKTNENYTYEVGTNKLREIDINTFKHDQNGNVVGTAYFKSIEYDPFTILTKKIKGLNADSTISLSYNSSNQRVRKVHSNGSLTYFHGLSHYPLLEVESINSEEKALGYVYGPTGVVCILDLGASSTSTEVYYPLKDHLGSTRALADYSGNSFPYFDYSPFGELLNGYASKPPIEVRYRFTGQEYDQEVGLYNYRARMYDPTVGRFYAPDPMGQQNSPYAYVGNNPISFTDPTGEWFGLDDVLATVGGAVIGGATELVSEAISGHVDWKKVGVATVAGAAAGETTLYAGPIAGGAVGGALTALGNDLVDGKGIGDIALDVGEGALIGGAMGGLGKAGKILKRGGKWVKSSLGKKASNILKRFGNSCGCFTEGTEIMIAEGYKEIQDIKVGDQVWAYNELTGDQELKSVVEVFELEREATYNLYFNGEQVETTSDHPFYNGVTWVAAQYLMQGDSVQGFDGEFIGLDSVKLTSGYTRVYNFEVENYHNYYINENGLLVHNPRCKITSNKIGKKFREVIALLKYRGPHTGTSTSSNVRILANRPPLARVPREATMNIYTSDGIRVGRYSATRFTRGRISGKKSGFDAGHIVPQQAGGSGRNINNIWAQNPQENRGNGGLNLWRQGEDRLLELLKEYKELKVIFKLKF